MAVDFNPVYRYRTNPFFSQTKQFRRKKGRVKTKKVQKKIKLKFKHILFCFILQIGIFFGVQQSYLFLLSWENLNVDKIEILCSQPEIKAEIQHFFKDKKLGNILLLDIGHLQQTLSIHRWIKDVQVKKIFPSSLKIEIKERTPVAVVKKETLFLIDKQGVLLEQINPQEIANYPLFIDLNNFEKDYQEKIKLAWECLANLFPSEKELIEVLDLSGYENVTVKLKESATRLILGNNKFSEKLRSYQKNRASLEKYGDLEYVDLRFPDRLFIKARKKTTRDDIPHSD